MRILVAAVTLSLLAAACTPPSLPLPTRGPTQAETDAHHTYLTAVERYLDGPPLPSDSTGIRVAVILAGGLLDDAQATFNVWRPLARSSDDMTEYIALHRAWLGSQRRQLAASQACLEYPESAWRACMVSLMENPEMQLSAKDRARMATLTAKLYGN